MSASIRENDAPAAVPGSAGGPKLNSPAEPLRGPMPEQPAADSRADCSEHTYSFGVYLRSHVGFVLAMAALMAVVAGILAVTGSNASAIALVSICEALFACIVLAVGFCAIVSSTSSWICSATRPKTRGIFRQFWTSRELWEALSPIARLLCRARRLPTSLPPALAT